MKYDDLISTVNITEIRKETVPPTPPNCPSLPSTPPYIEIISLYPPPKEMAMHPLTSLPYNLQLFVRVSEYFNRFYAPNDPNSTVASFFFPFLLIKLMVIKQVTLDKVEVICNRSLEKQFALENSIFEETYNGLNELRTADDSHLPQIYLDNLLTRFFLTLHHVLFICTNMKQQKSCV